MFLLITLSSLTGLFHSSIYQGFTQNWFAQTVGQDAIDLVLVAPIMMMSAIFAYRGQKELSLVWAGTQFYILYTFLIYCFTVRFNVLFIPYCATLGLSFYSLLWFFTGHRPQQDMISNRRVTRFTGIYFMVIAIVFYILWLMEIIPAQLHNEMPVSLTQAGLITNPVHIIDLAFFLPATFIVGKMALKNKPYAHFMLPSFLTFFILMDLTIALLAVFIWIRGLGGNLMVPVVMMVLAALSTVLLIKILNNRRKTDS